MNDTQEQKRKSPWLRDSSDRKFDETVRKVTAAMGKMEEDIDAHDGLYPFNGGTVNQSEVCRRANIDKRTLQGAAHKTSTKKDVDDWVIKINLDLISGKRKVRKVVTERADEWKQAHADIAQNYHKDSLLLDAMSLELKARDDRISELEEQNSALLELLEKNGISKVRIMKPKK